MSTQPHGPLRRSATVSGGAFAKFSAEVVALGMSLLTGILTARNLGPAGKGDLASIGFLSVIIGSAACIGLGEAAVRAMSERRRSATSVVGATTAILLATTSIGATACFAIGAAMFWSDISRLAPVLTYTALSVPGIAGVVVYGALNDFRRRYSFAAGGRVAGTVVTAIMTVVLVTVGDLGISGAALAALLGWVAAPVVSIVGVHVTGDLARPRWDARYARTALRFGAPVQISQLLMLATARVDVLIAHTIASGSIAGIYSVAVTIGSISSMPAIALAGAAFPQIATMPDAERAGYVARLARSTAILAVTVGAVIGATIPWIVEMLFGAGFNGSRVPAAVLLVGGVAWSVQYTLCRAMAATGRTVALVRSFATSLAVMIFGDIVLIPGLDAMGAAVASMVASVVGAAVIASSWRRLGMSWSMLIPRAADVADLRGTLRRTLGAAR